MIRPSLEEYQEVSHKLSSRRDTNGRHHLRDYQRHCGLPAGTQEPFAAILRGAAGVANAQGRARDRALPSSAPLRAGACRPAGQLAQREATALHQKLTWTAA